MTGRTRRRSGPTSGITLSRTVGEVVHAVVGVEALAVVQQHVDGVVQRPPVLLGANRGEGVHELDEVDLWPDLAVVVGVLAGGDVLDERQQELGELLATFEDVVVVAVLADGDVPLGDEVVLGLGVVRHRQPEVRRRDLFVPEDVGVEFRPIQLQELALIEVCRLHVLDFRNLLVGVVEDGAAVGTRDGFTVIGLFQHGHVGDAVGVSPNPDVIAALFVGAQQQPDDVLLRQPIPEPFEELPGVVGIAVLFDGFGVRRGQPKVGEGLHREHPLQLAFFSAAFGFVNVLYAGELAFEPPVLPLGLPMVEEEREEDRPEDDPAGGPPHEEQREREELAGQRRQRVDVELVPGDGVADDATRLIDAGVTRQQAGAFEAVPHPLPVLAAVLEIVEAAGRDVLVFGLLDADDGAVRRGRAVLEDDPVDVVRPGGALGVEHPAADPGVEPPIGVVLANAGADDVRGVDALRGEFVNVPLDAVEPQAVAR